MISEFPVAEPAVAEIVAVPSPTAVTSPEASTVATAGLPVDQVTVTPVITWPFWSRTWAASCRVSPRVVSAALGGLTNTAVARGGSGGEGGGTGSVEPSPQAAIQATHAPMIAEMRIRGRLKCDSFTLGRRGTTTSVKLRPAEMAGQTLSI